MPEAVLVAGIKPEVDTARSIHCAYCGLADKEYLAYCAVETCRKWFCNGTRDGLNKSHIIAHCGKTKHTSVSIFRGFPPATSKRKRQSLDFILSYCTYQPQCAKCRSTNIFDLGVEDPGEPCHPDKTWCRKHAVVNDKIGKDQWNPLVASHPEDEKTRAEEGFFIRVASWVLPVVKKEVMKENRGWSARMWGLEKLDREVEILEEFWRWKPQGTKEEFREWKRAVDGFTTTRRVDFPDRFDYASYWDSLVAELSRQEKGTVESLPPLRSLETKWLNLYDIEVKVPQGIFTEFLELGRPMEVKWIVQKNGEDYTMWRRDATISFLRQMDTGHVIGVHCLTPVKEGHHRVNEGLEFRMVYNDVNYWRMNQALYKLEHDWMCVSQEVLNIILGKTIITAELLEEWTSGDYVSTSFSPPDSEAEESDDEEEKYFKSIVPRTMNSHLRRFEPPPFHSEYVDAGTNFRSFKFTKLLLPRMNRCLNEKQRVAVDTALRTPVCLIQGPPGTGKTQTAAAIVVNLALQDPDGKILVCAPSNVAIDNLTLKIAGLSKDLKILRLFAHTRDIECLAEGVRKYTVFGKFRKERPKEPVTEGGLREFERACVRKAQIVCCTCNSAGLFSLEKVAFPYVLIDEAAQGMEPECLIAISRACEKLVLIGDPAQLGAVVRFSNLQRSQLTKSLFERLWERRHSANRVPWMVLTQQYRMHPQISNMVSTITYESKLVDDNCVVNRPPVSIVLQRIFAFSTPPHLVRYSPFMGGDGIVYQMPGHIPMVFVDLARNDELSGSGTSHVNMAEAHFIARLVANILHEGSVFPIPFIDKPKAEDVGIITFYNGQRPQLEVDLKWHPRVNARVKEIEINSVDGFQGREKEMIILSCVRSADSYKGRRSLGFTDDPQRLNVAMSRARRALIIVGNSRVFQYSPVWRQYFQYIPTVPMDAVCQWLPLLCSTKPPCKICPEGDEQRIKAVARIAGRQH